MRLMLLLDDSLEVLKRREIDEKMLECLNLSQTLASDTVVFAPSISD
jgi:hypothetical protein